MSSSANQRTNVRLVRGDLLASKAHALVNTVNCVGVMGKGIALAFKRRYPGMYHDYARRCDAGQVRLGEPYAFQAEDHLIINFPTKNHWRAVSRLQDIENGLDYLKEHLKQWGITSLAVPPLGCGNGQLEWSVVGPTLYRHLRTFGLPVELYVPHDIDPDEAQMSLIDLDVSKPSNGSEGPKVEAALVALVEILARIEREPYRLPIGRILFQKLAYFATVAGIPTGLTYVAKDFGPYAAELSKAIARLQNNGLVEEQHKGQRIEIRVGRTFDDAHDAYAGELEKWETAITRVTDFVSRLSSRRAEVAGSVHYVVTVLTERHGRVPTATEVLAAVEKWKTHRKPPIARSDIARAIVDLATQRWITVEPDESIKEAVEELVGA